MLHILEDSTVNAISENKGTLYIHLKEAVIYKPWYVY